MKRILLATAAIAAAPTIASAQVALTGSAELGITYNDTSASGDSEFQFWQDVDVQFILSGESDSGLTFGAVVDLDEAEDLRRPGAEFDDGGTSVFLSGNFGTITMGDTDGALDWALRDLDVLSPGSIDDAETSHLGYNGDFLDGHGDGQIVRYDYTFSQFSFAVSVEQPDPVDDGNLTWAIGFGYQFEFAGGTVDLGIGHQSARSGLTADELGNSRIFQPADTTATATAIGASIRFDSGFGIGASYTDFQFEAEDVRHFGIGFGHSWDRISIHANYGQFEVAPSGVTSSGLGLAAGYDLGGGASILFGYGTSDFDSPVPAADFNATSYSLGLSLAF